MGGMLQPKKLPTSIGGLRSGAKEVVGTGYSALLVVAGIGAAVAALPFVARVPIVGNLVGNGLAFVRPSQKADDGFGGF